MTLEADLGVSIKVCVRDAGSGNSRDEARFGLPGQVGFLLNCDKVHVTRGVEPETNPNLKSLRSVAKSLKFDSYINKQMVGHEF